MRDVALLTAPIVLLFLVLPLVHSVSRCRQGRSTKIKLPWWWISCSLVFLASLCSGLLVEFVGRVVFQVPAIRQSALCTIVSKGVDLRAARTCLSGNLSPVSIKLFGLPDLLKFHCSFEYYWIAVIEVELSSSTQFLLQMPKEALPDKCRPAFADVWRIAESFQENRSYPCTYTGKVIHSIDTPLRDDCEPESPSTLKLLRDYVVLIGSSYNLRQPTPTGSLFWKGVYALAIGLLYSIVVSLVTKVASWFQFKVLDPGHRDFIEVLLFETRLQVSFLIVTVTTAMVLSTTRFEQLRLGFQLLTGVDLRTKPFTNWLENIFL